MPVTQLLTVRPTNLVGTCAYWKHISSMVDTDGQKKCEHWALTCPMSMQFLRGLLSERSIVAISGERSHLHLRSMYRRSCHKGIATVKASAATVSALPAKRRKLHWMNFRPTMGTQAEMASGSGLPCPCEPHAQLVPIVDLIIS